MAVARPLRVTQPSVNAAHWSVAQVSNCQGATIGAPFTSACGRRWNDSHQAENEVREELQPSPQGSPAHGHQTSRWLGGQGTGLCPAGLQSPHLSHPLARPKPWGGSDPLPHAHLCDLMAAAVCLGPSAWDLDLAISGAWGAWGQLGPGHLAPSAMALGQGVGTWPWGSRQLRSASP